ncbi:MAG: STM3941 family protein [Paracoccus sp. (in: a-proteobacteria)]|nr:STM3941 family protein [Paracoccus sp. (in: a-proteobacteria)]
MAGDIRDQVIELRGSVPRVAGLFLLGVVMTGASLFVAWIPGAQNGLALLAGGFGAVFFGAITLFFIPQLAFGVVIRMDRDGFFDRRLSHSPVPWAAISNVFIWSSQGQPSVVVQVPPQVEAAIGMTRVARWTRGMNARLGADGLAVSPAGLGMDAAALAGAITARVLAARAAGGAQAITD